MAKEEKKIRFDSINIDGVVYKTLLTDKFKKRKKYEDFDPSKVVAFIPGTIYEILIKNKKNVKEGDIVMILEAMKMMNSVISPVSGEIRLLVKPGDIVKKNQILFEVI